jgi:hypothetical protein
MANIKFTHETRQKILQAIQNGCFRFQAAAFAGIDRKTLRAWEIEAESNPDGEHAEFVAELERAQFAAEAKLQMIHNALSTGGKLPDEIKANLAGDELADFRQRSMLPALQAQLKYGGSRPWAEIQKIEHTGKDGGAIKVQGEVTPQAAAALLREGFGSHARRALEADAEEEPAPNAEKPKPD